MCETDCHSMCLVKKMHLGGKRRDNNDDEGASFGGWGPRGEIEMPV